MRIVVNAIQNPHATVLRPHATYVVRNAATSDVPDISNATDVVRSPQGNATLIDGSDSNAVNVPTPPEVFASLNVYQTLANALTQADVIVLLTQSGAHNKTWSGEWGQAQVVDGTTSEPVVMMCDISADALLNSRDDVLEEAFNASLEIKCALEDTDDLERRSMLITSPLMTDPDYCIKLARKLFVKGDILKGGCTKKLRSEPRITVATDVKLADDVELHNRFNLLTQSLSGEDCNDDDDHSECSDDSVCSNDSEFDVLSGSERSRRRRKPRQDRKPKQREPPDRKKKLQEPPPKCDGITPSMPRGASSERSRDCLS